MPRAEIIHSRLLNPPSRSIHRANRLCVIDFGPPEMNALEINRGLPAGGRISPASRRLVVFRLAGQAYGIPLSAVKEIVSMPLLSQPPGLPPILAGFFNLTGTTVAAVRLSRLFATEDQPMGLYTPLLVLQHFGFPWAVIVEKVVGIVPIPESAILPVPENSSLNACAEGMAATDDCHIIILSPERLLLKTEQQRLAELTALEQKRLAELDGGNP